MAKLRFDIFLHKVEKNWGVVKVLFPPVPEGDDWREWPPLPSPLPIPPGPLKLRLFGEKEIMEIVKMIGV